VSDYVSTRNLLLRFILSLKYKIWYYLSSKRNNFKIKVSVNMHLPIKQCTEMRQKAIRTAKWCCQVYRSQTASLSRSNIFSIMHSCTKNPTFFHLFFSLENYVALHNKICHKWKLPKKHVLKSKGFHLLAHLRR